MVTHRWYAEGLSHFLAGDVDYDADTVKYALVESGYTPNLETHEFWSTSVESNEESADGYTAGGATLASKTNTVVDDASVSAWASATAYEVGDIVRPGTANGRIFVCAVAGTSGGSEPSFGSTALRETSDNGVIWVYIGGSYVALDAANPSWTAGSGATITARYGVMYVDGATPGTDDYLLAVADFESDRSASDGGTFEVQFHSTGILRQFRAA